MGTTKVTLNDGCTGLDMADGTKYTASRPGGHVEVADHHAAAIKRGFYGGTGIISTSGLAVTLGTKKGRRCEPCNRTWNCWSEHCNSCGRPTIPEESS